MEFFKIAGIILGILFTYLTIGGFLAGMYGYAVEKDPKLQGITMDQKMFIAVFCVIAWPIVGAFCIGCTWMELIMNWDKKWANLWKKRK